jgi:aspartate/methionine/tyrosine aminotransferase
VFPKLVEKQIVFYLIILLSNQLQINPNLFAMNLPISKPIVQNYIQKLKITDFGKANIRQFLGLAEALEQETGITFLHFEMGIPGLKAPNIAIEAEKKALENNSASIYPPIDGILPLKTEISKFVKNFLGINVHLKNCIPTVGSIMAAFLTFTVAGRREKQKDTILFLDPGFPVHKQQVKMLGLKTRAFDVYNFRGKGLKPKLEDILKQGNISTILYSNPNNPSWICFTEEELKTIGELATDYDAVIVEDLAYLGMDFRKDISSPGAPPFQSTVAKYTDNYCLTISTSKSFSYAGQRAGFLVISDNLAARDFEQLKEFYETSNFLSCITSGTIYSITGGITHSVQHGLTALFKATNSGEYDFVKQVRFMVKKQKF